MTTLSPEERAAELKWIARLVFAAGLAMGVWGREDLALVAFVVAFVCWLFS
jgi:EamA domain-containing membrane protein RarD